MTFRPKSLSEFSGQLKLSENLSLFVKAALSREESLDHVLLHGPPGLGKTTLAQIIASEMGSNLIRSSAPVLGDTRSIVSILSRLEDKDVLFIDEIHALPIQVEELLYSAMEDRKMDLVVGEGMDTRIVTIDLPEFTLVGATTRAGSLSKPLFDRFPIIFRLDYYEPSDLVPIIIDEAKRRNFCVNNLSALMIAEKSRGTPRVAKKLVSRISDFVFTYPDMPIETVIDIACEKIGIGYLGIDSEDFRYLNFLAKSDRPVGISTICAAISETKDSVEDIIEPFLLRNGLISRTPKGREITKTGLSILQNFEEDACNVIDYLVGQDG